MTVSLGAQCVFGCSKMCDNVLYKHNILPAGCPLPPGRPKTERGGRGGRLRHRAGGAHLIHGGYCDDYDEEKVEVEVVEKDEKGWEVFGSPPSPMSWMESE